MSAQRESKLHFAYVRMKFCGIQSNIEVLMKSIQFQVFVHSPLLSRYISFASTPNNSNNNNGRVQWHENKEMHNFILIEKETHAMNWTSKVSMVDWKCHSGYFEVIHQRNLDLPCLSKCPFIQVSLVELTVEWNHRLQSQLSAFA